MMELAAVKVRDCKFTYGKGKRAENVLDGVNLTVPSGVIYSLLGPSGCGKTTLLKIITGKLEAKSSEEISVFGSRPNSKHSIVPGPGIGYMPQELALYEDLTTEETLRLFARLNLVEESIIEDRIYKLVQVLELHLKKKLIRNLSGGQQRRVSLATALLHKPPLLILDEPTVGVDPLLRKKIWAYLFGLTVTGRTTIIITTHYIEEAKDAGLIGAMRLGRILVEDSPNNIMKTFGDNSLESCFYKMCYGDKSKYETNQQDVQEISALTLLTRTNSFKDDKPSIPVEFQNLPKDSQHFNKVKHLTKRNFVLRSRNVPAALFQIFVPVVSIICFCIAIGQPLSNVNVALVNEEHPSNFSSDFIDQIDTNIISYKHYDFDGGIASVVSGENHVVLRIKQNFTECVLNRLREGLNVDNDTLTCSSLSAHFDTTDLQVFYVLYTSFIQSIQSFFAKVLTNLGKTPLLASIAIDFSKPLFGSVDRGGAEYTIPGIVLMSVHFLSAASVILLAINDQRNGMGDKLWNSAVPWVDILMSYIVSEFIFGLAQILLILLYIFPIYGMPIHGSIILVIILIFVQNCTGMALGFFLSSILPKENAAPGVIMIFAIEFGHLFTNGILWPLEGMAIPWRTVVQYLPCTMANEALKGIIFRGWGLENLYVILGFLSSVVWFIVYFGLSLIVFKYKK